MTTPRTRAAVSLAVALTTLALGACAAGPSHFARDGVPVSPADAIAIRFDNEAQVYVDVYLVGDQREWPLGRVQPGARATLRIPEAALAGTSGFVQLAVLAGTVRSIQAARDPRATLTIAQPAGMLLSQRWTFSQRQLSAPEILGSHAASRRP